MCLYFIAVFLARPMSIYIMVNAYANLLLCQQLGSIVGWLSKACKAKSNLGILAACCAAKL